jgi:hypothetical protein
MAETKRTSKPNTGAQLLKSPCHRMRLQLLFFFFVYCGGMACAQTNLTGTWIADDFGIYYVRQIGSDVWWAGFSSESPYGRADLHRGLVFTNVFRGTLTGNTLAGSYVDVPKGQMLTSGPLTLTVVNENGLASQVVPNAYRATSWERFSVSTPQLDVFTLFNQVKKNQNAFEDHSLLDNLKPAKSTPVSILGRITYQQRSASPPYGTDPVLVKVAYPPTLQRDYADFICLRYVLASELSGCDPLYEDCALFVDVPDGDLTFDLHVDRGALDQQLGFWSSGWETSHNVTSADFLGKLNNSGPGESNLTNKIHAEVVMYGGTTECFDSGATNFLAPGWEQPGSLSALLNGVPIAGQVVLDSTPDPVDNLSVPLISVMGVPLPLDTFVRVNGILALDCGHGFTRPCHEDSPSYQNQEIHPVYSIDVIQDFSKARPFADLTGVWASDDAGTYYLRQDGNTVWWLGLSTDEGQSFANVFQGTMQNNQIIGSWADVPLGQTSNAGMMSVNTNNGIFSFMMSRLNPTGGFGGTSWEKLYDAGGRAIVIVFDQAEFASPLRAGTEQEFEIQAGPTRVTVKPQKPHVVKLPNGSEVTQADIPARIRVDAPELGGLHMSAQFAGYHANWSLTEADFKSGKHVQPMSQPRILGVKASPAENEATLSGVNKTASTAMKEPPTARAAKTGEVPALTIRYHIEPADPSGHDRLPK